MSAAPPQGAAGPDRAQTGDPFSGTVVQGTRRLGPFLTQKPVADRSTEKMDARRAGSRSRDERRFREKPEPHLAIAPVSIKSR